MEKLNSHLKKKYLWALYCVLITILDVMDVAVGMIHKILIFMERSKKYKPNRKKMNKTMSVSNKWKQQ